MVHIKSEGKFNGNTYLIDGNLFKLNGTFSLFIIENDGERMLIDTSSELSVRKSVNKMKELGLYPIHKILLTHSHWDHIQGVSKIKKLMKETEVEVLASERAIENLKNPKNINEGFGYEANPVENVTPLKDGEIINLNGLELEVMEFIGHTMDSIAIYDKKNKNIFAGDAFIDRFDEETFQPIFMPGDFNEPDVLKSFQKLKDMKDRINSISLAHYGVWKDKEYDKILEEMEPLYFQTKDSIIKWHDENPDVKSIALKFHEKFIKNSKLHTRENLGGFELQMEWFIKGLKMSGLLS